MRRSITHKFNNYKGLPCIRGRYFIQATTKRYFFGENFSINGKVEKIFVDGKNVDLSIFENTNSYDFKTSGYHIVEIYFKKDITSLSNLFAEVDALEYVDFYDFDECYIQYCSNMFRYNQGVKYINFHNFNGRYIMNADNMFNMFNSDGSEYDSALKTINFGGNFTLENCNSFSNIFRGCKELTSLNLKSWNLKQVGSLDTNSIRGYNRAFGNCPKLKEIYLYTKQINTNAIFSTVLFSGSTAENAKLYCGISNESDKTIYDVFKNYLGSNWSMEYYMI